MMMHIRQWRIAKPKEVPVQGLPDHLALIEGDCFDEIKKLADNSVDSIVTDPPYALVSIVKRFAKTSIDGTSKVERAAFDRSDPHARQSRGFMGQKWDNGDTAHNVAFWRECCRVLKPGGFVLAFGGTRTYHRLACAIEDAGFEIRDMVSWLYGSGFPKSHKQSDGWGTALKPACEPICMARKPLSEDTVAANVLRWGTSAINVDGCRVESEGGRERVGEASQGRRYSGNGSTDFAALPGPRGGSPTGRFPANVITDGSEEVMAEFPVTTSGMGAIKRESGSDKHGNRGSAYGEESRPAGTPMICHGDTGSAARFFYAAKATKKDRAGSKHPTVKPISLMRYLCRLVTPPGGIILDPFAGTGTTGEAAHLEGFKVIMIEREAEYCTDIRRRIADLNVEMTDEN